MTLYYDGNKIAEGGVRATQAIIFSADETLDIGYEAGTPVSPKYPTHTSKFNGKIRWVQLDAGVDDNDHFIDPGGPANRSAGRPAEQAARQGADPERSPWRRHRGGS